MSPARRGPRGRDEVRAALVDAGADLFAERGPEAVTTREIAERAGVNLGLLHRHIGTKDDLLREVLRREGEPVAAAIAQAIDCGDDPIGAVVDVFDANRRYLRILAQTILQRPDAAELSEFPVITAMRASGVGAPGVVFGSLLMGWAVFDRYLGAGTGVASADAVRQAIVALVSTIDLDSLAGASR